MATSDDWKRNLKQTKDPLAWSSWKNYCGEVKWKICLAEKEFMTQQVNDNRNNTNIMWKAIHSYIPKKSSSWRFFSKDINIVANEFNHFYVNIGKNTIQKISTLVEQFWCEEHYFTFAPREYPVSEQFFFDDNVSVNKVQKIIKSPGIEKIPLCVIKDCLPGIVPSVTSIINATFCSAQFPNVWKIAGSNTYLEGWRSGNS